jgi:hypothetical protein
MSHQAKIQAVGVMSGVTYDTVPLSPGTTTIGACGRSTSASSPRKWSRSCLRLWSLKSGGVDQSKHGAHARRCDVEPVSPDQAHRVGELAGRSGLEDVVDVTVVEGALRRGDDVVVTSNESHIRQVVDATGKRLRFETF